MANAFLGWLNQLVASLTPAGPLKQVGILTLSRTDDTPSFKALRDALHGKGYVEGRDISLHFRFAADDTELGALADQLLRIPNISVIVTGGTKALDAVNSRRVGSLASVKIVQAVGGDKVPADPNIRGFHIDRLQTCKDQVEHLIRKHHPTSVSILVDDQNNNPTYAPLAAHAAAKGLSVNPPVVAAKPGDLTDAKFSTVAGSFMMIPNGMYFDQAQKIADLLDGKDLPKIYPEREYWKAHRNKNKVIVHGHKIPETYTKAANVVFQFLEGQTPDPADVAEGDIDP
jgi:hypothetical protein